MTVDHRWCNGRWQRCPPGHRLAAAPLTAALSARWWSGCCRPRRSQANPSRKLQRRQVIDSRFKAPLKHPAPDMSACSIHQQAPHCRWLAPAHVRSTLRNPLPAPQIGVTNVYCAQLFYNQQQLKPGTAKALAQAVPDLPADALEEMQRAPMRRYDPEVLQVWAGGWERKPVACSGPGDTAHCRLHWLALGACAQSHPAHDSTDAPMRGTRRSLLCTACMRPSLTAARPSRRLSTRSLGVREGWG